MHTGRDLGLREGGWDFAITNDWADTEFYPVGRWATTMLCGPASGASATKRHPVSSNHSRTSPTL